MSKIVILNSGGFDSLTLIHYLHGLEKGGEIHSLHFLYGARNEAQQEKCVDRVCEKLGAVNMKIKLPEITWTKSDFFKEGFNYNTQYLEYRNLIFLSYALSYAQSIGADKVYLAVLKGGGYPDTSKTFFDGLNSFSKPLTGIEIITPFSEIENKEDLLPFAISSKLSPDEYFSCDTPKEDGSMCGECWDCQALNYINSILKVDHPFKALYRSDFDYSDKEFLNLVSKPPVSREVRALINNDCQLQCSHCFYGFERMAGNKVDKEVYYAALKELVTVHGFNNIHFSGKEPLYDDTLFWYTRKIKEDKLPCTYDLVTNGINIPKYESQLKESGISKVFLSIDEVFNTNGVRSVQGVYHKALDSCNKIGMPVEVFIDLHPKNWDHVGDILKFLYESHEVKSFFVRTIRSIGNAKGMVLLTSDQLDSVFLQLDSVTELYQDVSVSFSLSSEYIEVLGDKLLEAIGILDSWYSVNWRDNFNILLEAYCNRYDDITLTPDGYVLGCASEVSRPDYNKYSAGNILDTPINELLKKGNELRCSSQCLFKDKGFSCVTNKFR